MKLNFGVAMLATLLLAACASPQAAGPTAAGASADQTQVVSDAPVAKKKKCGDQTGSRLAPCGEGSTGDAVQGSSGDSYRDADMHSAFKRSPN